MCKTIKRPHCAGGSKVIHRRATLRETVSEQGYFTRNGKYRAKPEVL